MSFAILFTHPKFAANVGTIARNGELLGLDTLYVSRYDRIRKFVGATDTAKSFRRIGHFVDDDVMLITELKKNGHTIVAVELDADAVALTGYHHPDNIVYIIGSEDRGIPEDLMDLVDYTVVIPGEKPWSFNAADAATIVLYDRFYKSKIGAQPLPV